MITLLIGENSFENERELRTLAASFSGVPEMIDGNDLTVGQLPDLLMGMTLFAEKRMVIIKSLSDNKALWNSFSTWIDHLSNDVHLVLVEPKPDKRTKTYKDLQKAADVHESKVWTERDAGVVERWTVAEAKRIGFALGQANARVLVGLVGVDQWLLFQALEKLAVVDPVTPQVIEALIEGNPTENVFLLFEAALKGESSRVEKMLGVIELTEDAYRLLGLLSGQAVQLAVLVVAADKPDSEVAKDIGVHPYAIAKLAPFARKIGRAGARTIVMAFAEADEAVKTSAADPWLLIERALMKIAYLQQ
jgi:DNA polymerase-3 subunit delta